MHSLPSDWILHPYDWLDSTNTEALTLASQGASEGTVVTAKGQRAGRGRWGRTWESPFEKNLYISVVLKPKLSPQHVSVLSLVAGLATVQMLSEDYHVTAQLKWPNDIWVNGLKVGGILAEFQASPGSTNSVVVGLGLNVGEAPSYATSLLQATGKTAAIDEMGANWCHHLNACYQKFLTDGFSALKPAYESMMALKGELVKIEGNGNSISGTVMGVDGDGRLQLTDSKGQVIAVDAGEVVKVCC